MNDHAHSRGRTWLEALSGETGVVPGGPASILKADATLAGEKVRFLAVVPDAASRFPRARNGEVGLEQGWTLAKYVRETLDADRDGAPRPIVAIVDVPSQAYGRREELLGIHLAIAAAVDAYATARMAGHPIVALLVGKAMSGAFLGHGYQANQIIALDDPGVMVHAMGKAAAARVTKRSVEELDALGETVLPMSYSIRNYAKLGILRKLIAGINADAPDAADIEQVRAELIAAINDARAGAKVLELARAAGARKAEPMAVPVPSHCPLLTAVADELAAAIAAIAVVAPEMPYVSNKGGRLTSDPEMIRQDLARNVMYPVLWRDATTVLHEVGVKLFLEMPPGHTLTNLAAEAFDDARALALEDNRLDTVEVLAAREAALGTP
jgi:malonate decarboxylase gamma subunit